MIAFACAHCSQSLTVQDEWAGRPAQCPGCKQPLTVPGEHWSGELPVTWLVASTDARWVPVPSPWMPPPAAGPDPVVTALRVTRAPSTTRTWPERPPP